MNGSVGSALFCASILFAALHAGGADFNAPIENYRSSHEAAIVGELDQLIHLPVMRSGASNSGETDGGNFQTR